MGEASLEIGRIPRQIVTHAEDAFGLKMVEQPIACGEHAVRAFGVRMGGIEATGPGRLCVVLLQDSALGTEI